VYIYIYFQLGVDKDTPSPDNSEVPILHTPQN
jgi:hypothetical protein